MAKEVNGTLYGVKLMPTPVVGERVWWYDRADSNTIPYGADVLAVEEPGRVKLKIVRDRVFHKAEIVSGVRHMTDDQHKEENMTTRESGGWDWLRGIAPADQYDAHRNFLEKKEKNRIVEEAEAKRRIAERKEREAAMQPV